MVNWSQYLITFNKLIARTPETNVETIADIVETVGVSPNSSRVTSYYEIYKAALRKYKSDVRKAQYKSWIDFCSNIKYTSDAFRLSKIVASSPCTLEYLE